MKFGLDKFSVAQLEMQLLRLAIDRGQTLIRTIGESLLVAVEKQAARKRELRDQERRVKK